MENLLKDENTFRRLKTGGILLLTFLVLIWINNFTINFVLFAIMLGIAFSESLKLYELENESKYWFLIPLGFLVAIPFLTYEEPFSAGIKVGVFMLVFCASILAYMKAKSIKMLLPLIYPTIPIFLMFSLYNDLGIFYFVWMLFIVIASDSGAYFIGKAFGRTKFSETSPNKTIEGLLGGLVVSFFVSLIYAKFFTNLDFKDIFVTTIIVAIFGIFGDLFESYLKRRANVKDSGALFPGHGGVLDRIDGYLFGAIAMFLIYSW